MNQHRNRITEEVTEALDRILGYLEPDERLDYEARPECGQDNHVFLDVCFLRGWLEAVKGRAVRPVLGSRGKPPPVGGGPYSYRRGKDGCGETFDVSGPDGFCFSIPFWEAEEDAEKAAKRVVEALNDYQAATRRGAAARRPCSETRR